MAKKETNKKEPKNKKPSSKPKVEKKVEPVVEDNDIFDILEEQRIEFATEDDLFAEPTNNQEDIDVTEITTEPTKTEVEVTDKNETSIPEESGSIFEIGEELPLKEDKDMNNEKERIVALYRSGQTPNEDIPLIPEKRNPGNIFFKLKNKIRLLFE